MSSRIKPTKSKNKELFLTLLLLLTLPVFVFSIIENRSFDTRNKAFEEIMLSKLNPCIITFPNVNPYTLEVGKTVRIQVDAISDSSSIKEITITDERGETLFNKSYDSTINTRVTESFAYTPKFEGAYNLTGTLIDMTGKSFACVISSPYKAADEKAVKAITSNSKPEFLTTPQASKPSQSIKVGETYEYTLEAQDTDKDTINYAFSFTKGETWLKATVINDGGNGQLSIKFRGTPKRAGSYLANVFIHDGYSMHLSSQSWVISVSPEGNDNPVVTIIDPVSDTRITQDTKLTVTWEAIDSNQILRYEIYITSNPANESAWKAIDTKIPPTQNSYTIDLSGLENGAYRVIVRAIDDQDPAGVGIDVSKEIIIAKEEEEGPDDQPQLPQPQIINFSPTSTDEISNTSPTIKASLIATQNNTIVEDSIVFKIDDIDKTEELKINKISDSEHTLIYIPETPLAEGLHKVSVSFKDSSGEDITKEWTFTISGTQQGDTFNIFGLEISKRTTYIILGGITLILLAIFIPSIISSLWKEDSKQASAENMALPESIPPTPPTEMPQPSPQPTQSTAQPQESEQVFQAPEPEIPQMPQPSPQPTQSTAQPQEPQATFTAPEPQEDLSLLYEEIKKLEEETQTKETPNNSTE